MISRENSGPFLRDLSSGSSVKIQLDFLLNKIKDAREKWKTNLDAQESKANAIWKEFQETQDVNGERIALDSLRALSLETGRINALGKIEYLYAEIQSLVSTSLLLETEKIIEVATHCLKLCREEMPTASESEVQFKEHAATTTMGITKNEIHKRVSVKRLENIVLEYKDHIVDIERSKALFEDYSAKLNRFSRSTRPVTIDLRDKVVEEFREAIEFTIPAVAEVRSNYNKKIALNRMKALLIENPQIQDDPGVIKLLEVYTMHLNLGGLKKAIECEQEVKAFYTAVHDLFK